MEQDANVVKEDVPLLPKSDEIVIEQDVPFLHERELTGYDSMISLITVIFLMVAPILVSVIEFLTASYSSNVMCDVGAIVRLYVWLSISGLFGFACSMFGLAISLMLAMRSFKTRLVVMINGCIYILVLVWNIVGSVALFGSSSGCITESYSLWLTMFVSLIVGWITICAYIIVAIYVVCSKN